MNDFDQNIGQKPFLHQLPFFKVIFVSIAKTGSAVYRALNTNEQ